MGETQKVKRTRNRKPRETFGDSVPRKGMIGKKHLEALFGLSYQTISVKFAPFLPSPINEEPRYKDIMGPTSPKLWEAEKVWDAYRKIRGEGGAAA